MLAGHSWPFYGPKRFHFNMCDIVACILHLASCISEAEVKLQQLRNRIWIDLWPKLGTRNRIKKNKKKYKKSKLTPNPKTPIYMYISSQCPESLN